MPLVDLANTKVRVVGCSAVMAVGQLISNAIANPATLAAGLTGSTIALGGSFYLSCDRWWYCGEYRGE
ncbi:hypothetical protein IQ269_26965 [Tychonema sp. LEGE 07199]|uniref:hypothetical protein n=1 Tax=unclassified Tychonema TaxID=2642144 RepID=UPI001882585B|nr:MULTISPECIES: hypothetical protein [unclassified Tychonema]MBE9124334.1 hypothetical protein [Tychonema sp. LEGE 07199]MBE9135012.1 hypothetical protein [Tychonema sp. LEGE 07196]